MKLKSIITGCLFLLFGLAASAIELPIGDSLHRPDFYGTLRVKYALRTTDGAGQFQVKNAIAGVSGRILPTLAYCLEIDLDNNGKTKMRNAFARYTAPCGVTGTAGLMRVPFGIDVMRAPHLQYFANRSFIAKYGGNVRDVGLSLLYRTPTAVPLTIQAGAFQGNSVRSKANDWTSSYVFNTRLQANLSRAWALVGSLLRTRPDCSTVMMYDLAAAYNSPLWHFEAEGLYKHFTRNVGSTESPLRHTWIANAFALRNFPVSGAGALKNVAALCRYDYISLNSDAKTLDAVEPAKHRVTLGTTLRLGLGPVYAETRVSFEKYFRLSREDKITLEVMCRF